MQHEVQNILVNEACSSMLCAFNATPCKWEQTTLNRMIIYVSYLFALAGTASVTDYCIVNRTIMLAIRRRLNGVD